MNIRQSLSTWSILVLVLAVVFYAASIMAQPCPHNGDVNLDGRITSDDALLAFQHYLRLADPPLDTCQQDHANVLDPDRSAVTPADAQCLSRWLDGLPSCLARPPALTQMETSPTNGEDGVALTRETILRFSNPLAPTTVVDASAIIAEFGGQTLPVRMHLSADRRSVTLFYPDPLPASARIRVTVNGDALLDDVGRAADVDGDGRDGGTAMIEFNTITLTSLAGTRVCGCVFASELAAGDSGMSVNVPLQGVTITVDGAEDTLRAVTDAMGDFCLDPAPAGRFFVHIDGRTVSNGTAIGAFYPFVGKAWASVPGEETNVGDIFLPLIVAGTLQPVSQSQETRVTFPSSVLQDFPEFAGAEVRVPPDALFDNDGVRGGMVGIAPVAPDRLPGPLPPGLELPMVITVQTDGATNFDAPVPVTFPNLDALPPGTGTLLLSFNHDRGGWEVSGTAAVSTDGLAITSAPGSGLPAPGWHGTQTGAAPEAPKLGIDPRDLPPEEQWAFILETLMLNYDFKKNTANAGLAHQLLNLAELSVQNDAGDPIRNVLLDIAINTNARMRSGDFLDPVEEFFDRLPPDLFPELPPSFTVPPPINIPFPPFLPPSITAPPLTVPLSTIGDVAAVYGGFLHHFPDELAPGFHRDIGRQIDEAIANSDPNNPDDIRAHVDDAINEWRQEHDDFFENAVIPGFDMVHEAGEISELGREVAQETVPIAAKVYREVTIAQIISERVLSGDWPLDAIIPIPSPPPQTPTPIPPIDLSQPPPGRPEPRRALQIGVRPMNQDRAEPALSVIRQIVTTDDPILSVGRKYQLTVIKTDTSGNTVDLTGSATGTLYFAVSADPSIQVGPDGLLTLNGTPSPVVSVAVPLFVVIRNGDDFGIGRFAIIDVDTDGDSIVDSFEQRVGLDPNVNNGGTDTDGDGLTDILEILYGTSPTQADSDGDQFNDGAEWRARFLSPIVADTADRPQPTEAQHFVIENLVANEVIQRGSFQIGGVSDDLQVIASNTAHRFTVLDRATLATGFTDFQSPSSGSLFQIPGIFLQFSDAGDPDGDGLADDAEFVMGTNPNDADSDRDGIQDGIEVIQGTNPLDGIPIRTGIIATADTPGSALHVCAASDFIAVADADAGVSVFNIFNGMNPTIIAQIDTPGIAQVVACTDTRIAVADGEAGLAVIDMSDPPAARIVHQIDLGGVVQAVAVAGDVAYAGLDTGDIAGIELTSGTEAGRQAFSSEIHELAVEGNFLYVLTGLDHRIGHSMRSSPQQLVSDRSITCLKSIS